MNVNTGVYVCVHSLVSTVYSCIHVFLHVQRMDSKLSAMQEKINEAQSPLPLFTCLHVKPDVSELMFAGKNVSVCFLESVYEGYCLYANC